MNDFNVILADLPGLGRVRVCDCNSIHVSVGPVTLNLSPEAFAQAAAMFGDAMRRYAKLLESQMATSPGSFPAAKTSLVTH
ncbi:hypothetical protein [Silvibacterium dinghuense]|uniref:Uncharacterized protein n=1 Tax=Silvibacterium dinghuense TaxID=1560006 RepID=A0A4Q1SEY4_9BACT|nr:hypothetical protein [Silvibacterium dinghuense]RXS95478.1 hypothetical protein ESZ00_12955 [Silvibacterium dinghuense]GGH13454.1 hypothetical protein GCM10011586_33340 [Silvibacterium dinghuense]